MQAATQDTNKLADSVDKLSSKLEGLTKRAGKKLMLFGAGGAAGLTAMAYEAGQFEKQLSVLNATSAVTERKIGAARDQIRQLGREFPITRQQASALITTMDTLGATSGKNMQLVSESMVKLSAATGEDLLGLTTQMVTLQKQMGTLNSGTIENFSNSLLAVSKNAGVSASNVLSFASAIAPAARAADMSQSSMLGVATAFSRAGADGFAAAGTFNTMVNDITRQVVTGSPEIAKYSNLIGVTAAQFKNMDKGEAVTRIFETISKQGPDAIKTLDRLGFDGVRAVKSIQAVSQSGNMRKAIADATGAYQSTDALDKGGAAAMSGLFDQMAKTKNMMQDISTEAGTPLLRFFTELGRAVNAVVAPFEPLIAAIAKVGGGLAALSVLPIMALGASMTAATVKTAVSGAGFVAGSLPVRGFRGGLDVGRGAFTERGAAAAERAATGQMRYWERPFYSVGQGIGQAIGPGGEGPGMATRLATMPMRGAGAVMRMQTEFYRQSVLPGTMREAPFLNAVGRAGASAEGSFASLAARARVYAQPSMWPMLAAGFRGTQGVGGAAAGATSVADFEAKMKDAAKATAASTTATIRSLTAATGARAAEITASRGLAVETGALTKTFLSLQWAGVKATATLGAQAGMGAARGLGGAVLGMAGGPYVAGALALGGAAYMGHKILQENKVEAPESSPIDKYNAALGISTSELGSFADAVAGATKALPSSGTIKSAEGGINPAVVELANMPKRELTNDIFGNLKSTGSRAAMMQLMGMTDSRQLNLVQADLVQSQGEGRAQAATNAFYLRRNRGAGANYGALVKDMRSEQMQGLLENFAGKADPTAEKMVQAVYGALEGQYGENAKRYSSPYANQKQVNEIGKFIGAAGKTQAGKMFGTSDARTLTQAVSGFEKSFLGGQETGFNATRFANQTTGMSESERGAAFWKFIGQGDSEKGQDLVRKMRKQGISFAGMSGQDLNSLKFTDPSEYVKGIQGIGATGEFALKNKAIQRAVDLPGDVNAQYRGINTLFQKATSLGEGFSGTDAELQRFKAAIKDVNDPLYKLAQNAQLLNQKAQADAAGNMGRVGQLGQSVQYFRDVRREDPNATDHQERLDQARDNFVAMRKQYRDYTVGVVLAVREFGIQQRRAEADNERSIRYSNKDFNISMTQAADDYHRSRLISERDFGIAMAQQTEDFQIQMTRSNKDFNRSLTRNAEDVAKSIYDPFHRIEAQATSSAGTLLNNLKEQNQKINEQRQNVEALKKAGLSQKSIDVLNLMDPSKARQVERMRDDLEQTPGDIKRINRQTAKRGDAVDALVNNPLSQQYRRTMADYHRGINQATDDFERSQARANEANARMLSDMAINYDIMVSRANDAHTRGLNRMQSAFERSQKRATNDLVRMSKEITGDLGEVMDTAYRVIARNLGKAGDKLITELDKVRAKYPELFKDAFGDTSVTNYPGIGDVPNAMPPDASGGVHPKHHGDGKSSGTSDPRAHAVPGGSLPPRKNARGGIATGAQYGIWGEAGPEAMIPLNSDGAQFMASMMKDLYTIASPARGGSGSMYVDKSNKFSGPISVEATDPDSMAKKLAEKARVRKLTRPNS